MTAVVLAFAIFFVRFIAAEASYQRARRTGHEYHFPVGVGLRILFRLGGPFLIFVGFKMGQQAATSFDGITSGLVAAMGVACLLVEPDEIVTTPNGVIQTRLFGLRSRHIPWHEAAARSVPSLREILIVGRDGTEITHSQYHVGQDQMLFEIEKHGVLVQQ